MSFLRITQLAMFTWSAMVIILAFNKNWFLPNEYLSVSMLKIGFPLYKSQFDS
jgi:hypothetical protein